MKLETHSPTCEMDSVATGLLLLADLIHGHARRLENMGAWQDVKHRSSNAEAEGEPKSHAGLIRLVQASRIAENDTDQDFLIICQMGESFADTIFENDPELHELHAKMRAVEKSEQLTDSYEFDPEHPETPADWKQLNAQRDERFRKVERLYHNRFTGWLRRHGETVMADLYVDDRAAFDRRREAARLLVFGPFPAKATDPNQGDPELTEVAGGDE